MLVAQGLSLLVDGGGGSLELLHGGFDVGFLGGLDVCKVVQVRETVYLAALV